MTKSPPAVNPEVVTEKLDRDQIRRLLPRFNTIRAYKRAAEIVVKQALAGVRPMDDATGIVNAIKGLSEVHMLEHQLAQAGLLVEVPVDPSIEAVAQEIADQAKPYRRIKKTVTTGRTATGPVDTETVVEEGSHQVVDLDPDVQDLIEDLPEDAQALW